jgi:hypothetical protein
MTLIAFAGFHSSNPPFFSFSIVSFGADYNVFKNIKAYGVNIAAIAPGVFD